MYLFFNLCLPHEHQRQLDSNKTVYTSSPLFIKRFSGRGQKKAGMSVFSTRDVFNEEILSIVLDPAVRFTLPPGVPSVALLPLLKVVRG